MTWQFASVNRKLAEVFFEKKKILGFCYVDEKKYTTKKEQKWIENDTKKCQLSYRKEVFRDVHTKKIVPQSDEWLKEIDLKDTVTLEEFQKELKLSATSNAKKERHKKQKNQ